MGHVTFVLMFDLCQEPAVEEIVKDTRWDMSSESDAQEDDAQQDSDSDCEDGAKNTVDGGASKQVAAVQCVLCEALPDKDLPHFFSIPRRD